MAFYPLDNNYSSRNDLRLLNQEATKIGADYKKANKCLIGGVSRDNLPANATQWHPIFGQGTDGGAAVGREIMISEAGVALHLYYRTDAAPGAGETFDITLYLNGAPTALTCQIAGAAAQEAQDLVNQIALVPNDRIVFQIVTSLNAAVTRHHWGFTIRT